MKILPEQMRNLKKGRQITQKRECKLFYFEEFVAWRNKILLKEWGVDETTLLDTYVFLRNFETVNKGKKQHLTPCFDFSNLRESVFILHNGKFTFHADYESYGINRSMKRSEMLNQLGEFRTKIT